jgi:hypothetical protein
MIKKVRIDYSSEHAPGQLVMVCGSNGYIIFDRDAKKKCPCRSATPARAKAKKMYASIIGDERSKVNGNVNGKNSATGKRYGLKMAECGQQLPQADRCAEGCERHAQPDGTLGRSRSEAPAPEQAD